MRLPWLNDWGEGSFLCHPYHRHHHYKACWWSLSSLMPDLFKIFHQQDLLQFGPPGHLGIRGNVESLNDATLLFQHVQPWRHWGGGVLTLLLCYTATNWSVLEWYIHRACPPVFRSMLPIKAPPRVCVFCYTVTDCFGDILPYLHTPGDLAI